MQSVDAEAATISLVSFLRERPARLFYNASMSNVGQLVTPEPQPLRRSVAVMQPYFFPYAGYFRLFAAAETFVIFDDVQFPRRGRVHRCQVPRQDGAMEWLTLPLARHSRETMINDLAFAPGARDILDQRLTRLRWLSAGSGPWADRVRAHLQGPLDSVVGFLEAGLRLVAEALDLQPRIVRSSGFALDSHLRGQDRVIALVHALKGSTYVNPPGGRALYQAEAFNRTGLELKFLVPYTGDGGSVLPTLVAAPTKSLRAQFRQQTQFLDG